MALQTDTIAAIATALGESGIAVVRVSGPDAVRIVGVLARAAPTLSRVASHTVHHAWLHDESGDILDEALVTVMRAPRTYTGEDVVEIGVHGGPVPARRVLRAVLAAGARLADRGEFTKRAFLNGRMDLSQAEAVVDLVRARTERSADAALAALAGRLAARTVAVEERLWDLLARLEVNLDFSEDVEAVSRDEIGGLLGDCAAELEELRRRAPWGRRLREGATVVLVGRPNVGKSSLFNALLEDERALVNETPGTTRDYLEAWIDLAGIPVRLLDTAGLREGGGTVETEGVRRAQAQEAVADLRIVILDAAEGWTAADREILAEMSGRARLLVWNKIDLARPPADGGSEGGGGEEVDLHVSAKTGEGVLALREGIGKRLVRGVGREPADEVVPSERHEDAIRRAVASLELAHRSFAAGETEEFLAGDVRDAIEALGEITGRTVGEDILERIFCQFCIGK
jgi:tRNA modification GTPase